MVETVWLHIGAEKTGTTSVQATLSANRNLLSQSGILYPATPGDKNHTKLTAYALDDKKVDDETRILNNVRPLKLQAFRSSFETELKREVQASGCKVVILSNEHCSSRLRSVDEIGRLKTLLSGISDDIRVIFYIRHPVDFIASWYSTTVTGGATKPLGIPLNDGTLDKVRFRSMLDNWEKVFSRDKLFVRRFDRKYLLAGNLIRDFMSIISDRDLTLSEVEPKNQSLGVRAIIMLRELNKHVPRIHNRQLNILRGQLVEALRQADNGPRYVLPRSEADRIMGLLQEDHKHIASEYFHTNEELFGSPSSVADQSNDAGELSFEEAASMAAAIWTFGRKQNMALGRQLNRIRQSQHEK